MYLKLEKLGKKIKNSFLSVVWFEESRKEKNRKEKCKKNLSCHEEKFFLTNMKGVDQILCNGHIIH